MKLYIFFAGAILGLFSGIASPQSCHSNAAGQKHESSTTPAPAVVPRPTTQTKCPIMVKPVNRSVSIVWEGDSSHAAKRIYFCCPGCVERFKADPAKYIHKLEDIMRQPLENAAIENMPDQNKDKQEN